MSIIFYKFKNNRADRALTTKDWKKINFDGAVLSVLDLKRAIVEQCDLRESKNFFDLLLTNSQTGEDYREEGYLVPRHSFLLARRVPTTKEVSMRIREPPVTTDAEGDKAEPLYGGGRVIPKDATSEEDKKMLEVVSGGVQTPSFQVSGIPNPRDELYKRNPSSSSSSSHSSSFNRFEHNRFDPSAKPPPGYVCHRCRQSGHYIRFCPTNGDPNFNFRRPKPATGIPRSFLKPVEPPQSGGDVESQKPTLMLPDHTYAVAMPNQRQFARSLASSGSTVPLSQNPDDPSILPPRLTTEKLRPEFYCPLCTRPFVNAIRTDCCNSTFCEPCIRRTLTSTDNAQCPTCRSYGCDPSKLTPNVDFQKAVDEFFKANPDQMRATAAVAAAVAAGGGGGMEQGQQGMMMNGMAAGPNTTTNPNPNPYSDSLPDSLRSRSPGPGDFPRPKREINPNNTCFQCGERGHYAVDCANALNPTAYNPLRGRFASSSHFVPRRGGFDRPFAGSRGIAITARKNGAFDEGEGSSGRDYGEERALERRMEEVDRRERERLMVEEAILLGVPPPASMVGDPFLTDVRDLPLIGGDEYGGNMSTKRLTPPRHYSRERGDGGGGSGGSSRYRSRSPHRGDRHHHESDRHESNRHESDRRESNRHESDRHESDRHGSRSNGGGRHSHRSHDHSNSNSSSNRRSSTERSSSGRRRSGSRSKSRHSPSHRSSSSRTSHSHSKSSSSRR